MLDKTLHFFIDNIVGIIELLFVIAIPMGVYLLYRSFKQEKEDLDLNIDQMKGLEEILKKYLSHQPPAGGATSVAQGSGDLSASNVTSSQPVPADVQAMVKEKEQLILQMSEKIKLLEASAQKAPAADSKVWEQKIDELKARLMEYEIIEDDIANLSFYKSENSRLKEELAKLGVNISVPPNEPPAIKLKPEATAPSPSPVSAAAPSTSQPQTTPNLEELMKTLAPSEIVTATNTDESNVISLPNAPTVKKDDNVMSEFEMAVQQKNKIEVAATKVIKVKPTSTLAVDEEDDSHAKEPVYNSLESKSEATSASVKDDIIAEFSAAVTDTPPETSKPQPGFEAASVDSEKLLNEINQMAAEPAPPKKSESEVDDSKKLISEFEAFVKGSGS